jgi:hypothetical protein
MIICIFFLGLNLLNQLLELLLGLIIVNLLILILIEVHLLNMFLDLLFSLFLISILILIWIVVYNNSWLSEMCRSYSLIFVNCCDDLVDSFLVLLHLFVHNFKSVSHVNDLSFDESVGHQLLLVSVLFKLLEFHRPISKIL